MHAIGKKEMRTHMQFSLVHLLFTNSAIFKETVKTDSVSTRSYCGNCQSNANCSVLRSNILNDITVSSGIICNVSFKMGVS